MDDDGDFSFPDFDESVAMPPAARAGLAATVADQEARATMRRLHLRRDLAMVLEMALDDGVPPWTARAEFQVFGDMLDGGAIV